MAAALESKGNYKEATEVYERLKKDYPSSPEGAQIDKYISRANTLAGNKMIKTGLKVRFSFYGHVYTPKNLNDFGSTPLPSAAGCVLPSLYQNGTLKLLKPYLQVQEIV